MRHALFLFFTLFPLVAFAQKVNQKNDPYAADWKNADSLTNQGLPESARAILQNIYAKASAAHQPVQQLKARLYLLRTNRDGEDAGKAAIASTDSLARISGFPNAAIWQSISGELLWNYYNQHRWQILPRTTLAVNVSNDLDEWDAPRFYKEISARYLASIQDEEGLVNIALDRFEPILITGANTRNLRPTLYDLLSFRALDWFEQDEKELARPASHFTLDRKDYFAEAKAFARLDIQSLAGDTASLQLRALKIYQQLLRRFDADDNAEALIDADLGRLAFVYQNSVLPEKDALCRKALLEITTSFPNAKGSAEAAYRIALLDYGREPRGPVLHDEEEQVTGGKSKARNLRDIKARLAQLIEKAPDTEGGMHARQLLQQIAAQSLQLTAEEVIVPGETSKALVTYKNTPTVYLRLIRLNEAQYQSLLRGNEQKRAAFLTTKKPWEEWTEQLPATEDFEMHSAEIKVNALQPGIYALLASADGQFSSTDNILNYITFQASNISFVLQRNASSPSFGGGRGEDAGGRGAAAYILHRKTGVPLDGALVKLFRESWNSRTSTYDEVLGSSSTSVNGVASLGGKNTSYNTTTVSWNGETLYLHDYLSLYSYNDRQQDQTKTFFFTDRAIYRPGQTIYFKGILLRSADGGRSNTVLPNTATEVSLYDANSQKVQTLKLKSNEFGSVTGTFTAPGALTGGMSVRNDWGSVSFSVEEYKRPKFSVDFDTLKEAYALNKEVKIAGKANAYAGNAIDGAMVKYRVVREARFPYWWLYWRWGQPYSASAEIAQGTTQTDGEGKFTVSFTTTPDAAIAKETLPVFTYTVYADLTDLNGETHSGQQGISAGYRSVQIAASIPESGTPQELDTLYIPTQNLNGEFVAAKLRIRIRPLQQPEVLPRKRLWQQPDQRLLDSLTFKKEFPLDEFGGESDFRTWPAGAATFSKTITTTRDGLVLIPQSAYPRKGHYVVELVAADPGGDSVMDKKFVAVWDQNLPGKLLTPLSVHGAAAQYEPGTTAALTVNSAYDNVQLAEVAAYANGSVRSVLRPQIPAVSMSWSKLITEDDRGGIALQWLLVKDNRVYQQSAFVNVPWSNKQLNIAWETHRDKLEPGAKETWTMIVSGPKKEKVAAEMVATLYDASLDALRPHSWGINGLFPQTYQRASFETGHGFGTTGSFGLSNPVVTQILPYAKVYDDLLFAERWNYNGYYRQSRWKSLAGDGALDRFADVSDETVASLKQAESTGRAFGERRPVAANEISEDDKPRHMMLPEPKAVDSDGDGVADQFDKCPGTPAGVSVDGTGCPASANVPLRKNLQETAFFYPQLKTDEAGNVRIEFTIPEALTEWKLLAFAHTPDLKTGIATGTVKTQKDLMVVPGLPRFFRQGDDMILTAKVSNLSEAALNGEATLEIADAQTGQSLNTQFRIAAVASNGGAGGGAVWTAGKSGSTSVSWRIHIPEARYEPVLVRISARAGNFTDGEENLLPIITNRALVTETTPMWMNGSGTKTYNIHKLTNSAGPSSPPSGGGRGEATMAPYALTIEYTPNPAWYAVQALPYLMEYPWECAEQTFNRYYANALAGYIVKQSPKVEAIFKEWEGKDTAALLSNLEKNQELKSALLEETPWVLEAKDETEQKHRIALLFQSHKLSRELDKTLRKLNDMMLPEGGFPWFKGDTRPDRYITQYVVTGLGHLEHLGVSENAGGLAEKMLPYLDGQVRKDYESLLQQKVDMKLQQISYLQVQYLYARSFFKAPVSAANQKAYSYYQRQAAQYWPSFNPYLKGMIALALHRSGDSKTTAPILQSLRETSIRKEEPGTYWMENNSYRWYEAPIEAQSLLIECFAEVGKDTATADAARRWLLKQKQTQNWHSTKATADACYAILLTGSSWLTQSPQVSIKAGSTVITSPSFAGAGGDDAGTGYIKQRIAAKDIKPDMSTVVLTVSNTNHGDGAGSPPPGAGAMPSWGAIYYQYFEDLDKITAASTGLSLTKQLFIRRNTPDGPKLVPIADAAASSPSFGVGRGEDSSVGRGEALHIGDRLTARIILRADRDLEYVQLKDMRAACMEPLNVLSGYRWQGGLGYYESTRDVSSSFFISYLPKGTYVFEYDVNVTAKGDFSNGIATIQCMYAPEFSAHSEGIRIKVE